MICILARFFLKEKLTVIHILCLLLTIAGVFLITQPSFLIPKNYNTTQNSENGTKKSSQSNVPSIGIPLGILSAFCSSCAAILVKNLPGVHFSISILFASFIGLPLALVISLGMYFGNLRKVDSSDYDTTEKLLLQILFLFLSSLCGCIFQIFFVISNRYDTASKLAIVSTTNLFWSFALQYVILNIGANIFSISGALLIFLSVVLCSLIKIMEEKLKIGNEENNCFMLVKRFLFFKF